MNDLLFKLRQQLTSMIEEIDNFKSVPLNTIFIKKVDFKSIKYIAETSSSKHVFEYQKGVKFILYNHENIPYHLETYTKLMNGTLELLILNKCDKVHTTRGYSINYEIENENKTRLRNIYVPIEEGNNKLSV